ncbi:hypothetical protein E4U42_001097 [Claviceps africana]|uniref:Extracellular serine-rich protein n=1 Tax=Claviceps africana TaxID=83212 RepID=A0A8K0JC29_9HYPO|nr:hypothetical protein E4U42_001097 [Claviceps africana]
MYFTNIVTAAAVSLLAAQASAKTISIDVGKDGLTFSPDSVKADKGDVLEFHFYNVHSVAMGDFAKGCAPAAKGGFYSGFVRSSKSGPDGENKDVFQVTVDSTDPTPFYCTVGSHCQAGMVGVINPSSTDSLDKYKKKVQTVAENMSPSEAFGGKMVASSGKSDGGKSDVSTSASPTGTSRASSTSAAPQASKTAGASQIKTSLLVGVGAMALGFAALLI